MPNPVRYMGRDTWNAFSGSSLWFHGSAVAATLALSPTGGDHATRLWVQQYAETTRTWQETTVYGGYLIPPLLATGLYVAGLFQQDSALAGAGSAAVEALVISSLATVFLKIATGRPFPMHGGDPKAPDRLQHPEYATEFVPFGLSWRYAWPSGHTAVSLAVVSALHAYSPDSRLIPWIGYPAVAGIAAGMLLGDHHWLSDVIAGGLMGQAIGWSVGSSFRARAVSGHVASTPPRWTLVPLFGSMQGCACVGSF